MPTEPNQKSETYSEILKAGVGDVSLKPVEESQEKEILVHAFNHVLALCHETAKSKGWWDLPQPIQELIKLNPEFRPFLEKISHNPGEKIMLQVCELAEAVENLRAGTPPDDKIPEFSGVEAELADCIIRIFDMAGKYQLDVVGAMFAKMEYNKGRSYRHGKKF